MRGHHVDVVVVEAPVRLLVLDPQVREVHLAVEVRQVMLERPVADLFGRAIGVAVVVAAFPNRARAASAGSRA